MRFLFFLSVVFCLLFGNVQNAQAKPVMFKIGTTSVTGWMPDNYQTSGKTYPLVLFSHGFGGCPAQSRFLTEELAKHGYIVLAPRHTDARCGSGANRKLDILKNLGQGRPQQPFRKANLWSDATYRNRHDDMVKLLDYALTSDQFKPYIDASHIGLMGHSLGGYTVLGLAGAWPSWKEPRIKAVLALSPYSDPFLVKGTLKNIDVPVMYQGGTNDSGITPGLKRSRGVYDQTPSPKYFADLQGAAHFAWTERGTSYRQVIIRYSEAFLDHYLMEKDAPLLTAKPDKQLAEFRSDP